jgi:hypothetical protein
MTLPKTQVAKALIQCLPRKKCKFLLYVCGHRDFFIKSDQNTLQEVKIHE